MSSSTPIQVIDWDHGNDEAHLMTSRNRTFLVLITALAALVVLQSARGAHDSDRFAIHDVRVFDGTVRIERATDVVRAGVIVDVAVDADVRIWKNGHAVDRSPGHDHTGEEHDD
jgi:hypothetical protein